MATTVLETLGTVRPDGTLELDQKIPLRPGRVKVRVESTEPPAQVKESLVKFVQRSRRELEDAGHRFRSRQEIDAELDEMRAEWDAASDGLEPTPGPGGQGAEPAC
jgi:hypothetical protein